ncbi:MAG: helix-turn-helix transcriptional regulator [Bacteroidota bacterium]
MLILKQLRSKKKINQKDFARAIGVSLRTVQLYERKEANIPIKNLIKIAQYFEVSIAELYALEGVQENEAVYQVDDNSQKEYSITKLAPGKYLVSAPLILGEQYNTFCRHYTQKNYLTKLPKTSFVIDQVSVGAYMTFEVVNSGMDDGSKAGIPVKSIVLGKGVSTSKMEKIVNQTGKAAFVIEYQGNLMCKELAHYNRQRRTILCKSRNRSPEYGDFEAKIDDLGLLYLVIGKQITMS